MNNERLAALIGEGGNDELIPLLWENMRKLFRMWADSYYTKYRERCNLCGVTNEDLRQEGYFAMLEAVKAYNSRPEENKETPFASYCHYPFKNRAAELIGMRTKQARSEPMNNNARISLDEPIKTPEGGADDSETVGGFIPDPEAEQPFREIEEADFCRAIRDIVKAALANHPKELETLERNFYNGESLASIGADMGVSTSRAGTLKNNALRRLRYNGALMRFAEINNYKRVNKRDCLAFGSAVEQITEQRETYQNEFEKSYKKFLEEHGLNAEEAEHLDIREFI